jgi:hypothetical protein
LTDRVLPRKIRELLREKIRLIPAHRWTLYVVTALVWLSGCLWLGVEKWKEPGDSEWGPFLMKIHGAVAMAVLLLLGSMVTHVLRGLALKRNRILGFFLIGLFLWLTVTGWFLYYAGDDRWRDFSSLAHWTAGLALPMLLAAHILVGRKVFRARNRKNS